MEEKIIKKEITGLVKQINKLKVKRDKTNTKFNAQIVLIESELQEQRDKLQFVCSHEKTHNKELYIEGSYYNKSEYITDIVCDNCGLILKTKKTLGGYG